MVETNDGISSLSHEVFTWRKKSTPGSKTTEARVKMCAAVMSAFEEGPVGVFHAAEAIKNSGSASFGKTNRRGRMAELAVGDGKYSGGAESNPLQRMAELAVGDGRGRRTHGFCVDANGVTFFGTNEMPKSRRAPLVNVMSKMNVDFIEGRITKFQLEGAKRRSKWVGY